MQILIASPNQYLYELLTQYFTDINLMLATDGEMFFKQKMLPSLKLIILDSALNLDLDNDLIESFDVPFIYLSSHNDQVNLLENHYLMTKPIKVIQLIELVVRLLNPYDYFKDITKINNNFSFSFENKSLITHAETSYDRMIPLTEKEALIIKFLYNSREHKSSKAIILKEIWNYNNEIDTHTLETHIYRLRQKVGTDQGLIVTTDDGYALSVVLNGS